MASMENRIWRDLPNISEDHLKGSKISMNIGKNYDEANTTLVAALFRRETASLLRPTFSLCNLPS
ncbi:hypothetical protein [Granulicella sp. L46]|uniref:hypothetical protein n=1 Tax=Granulicella sp. L46 TaxID=1641865 RepID=UPI0020B1208D|nr:hypothetical protein [Granulicella sp. L46]